MTVSNERLRWLSSPDYIGSEPGQLAAELLATRSELVRLRAACHEERQRLLQAAESAQLIGKWDAATEYKRRAEALSGAIKESEEI